MAGKVTLEIENRIRVLWADLNMTREQIAEALGISQITLWLVTNKLGLPRRVRGRRAGQTHEVLGIKQSKATKRGQIDMQKFANMFRTGVLVRKISEEFGISRSEVSLLAKKAGLPPRQRGLKKGQEIKGDIDDDRIASELAEIHRREFLDRQQVDLWRHEDPRVGAVGNW